MELGRFFLASGTTERTRVADISSAWFSPRVRELQRLPVCLERFEVGVVLPPPLPDWPATAGPVIGWECEIFSRAGGVACGRDGCSTFDASCGFSSVIGTFGVWRAGKFSL